MHLQNDALSQSPSTTTESEFVLNGRRLSLKRSFSVSVAQQPKDSGMQFLNFPCELVDNQLVKYFRITHRDTTIYVEDKISIQGQVGNFQKQQAGDKGQREGPTGQKRRKSAKGKKMILFKHNSLKNAEFSEKNDKKNIVKNVVNAFLKCLKEGKLAEEPPHQVIQAVSKLIQAKKFNNQLIAALVEQKTLRQYFKKFVILQGLEWIENSKLKIKQIYRQALQIYEKLCDNEDKKQQKRNKASPEEAGEENSNRSFNLRQLENYDLEEAIRGFK